MSERSSWRNFVQKVVSVTKSDQCGIVEALERRLLEPAVRSSSKELDELLAEDFLEFGSSGRVWTRSEIVAELLTESGSEIEIDSARSRHISEDVILLTYRSMRVGDTDAAAALRSSIWQRQGGIWKLIFHQGTKVRPSP